MSEAQQLDVFPSSEEQRLAAVRRYDILDTPADGSFDRVTAIAANLFSVPISIISLVDHDRIWFKSHHGLEVEQIDRSPGLCASAILNAEPWLLTDAKTDVRSLTNPLVAGDFGLRFYLGIPLRTHDGFNLGTLCVIDHEPRTVSDQQIANLRGLAMIVMDQMELRLSARRAVTSLEQVIKQKDTALERAALLTKEVDHRVMNSLQVTSALLRMHHRTLGNSPAAEEIHLAAVRVSAIALVHRHIYLRENVEATDCKTYLEGLCADLSETLLGNRPPILLRTIEAPISTNRIVPLGLIVAELVTNAAKHGKGEISVLLKRIPSGSFSLSVTDEGEGMPANYDTAAGAGLGTKVIAAMTAQLGGRLTAGRIEDTGRFGFTIEFPNIEMSKGA